MIRSFRIHSSRSASKLLESTASRPTRAESGRSRAYGAPFWLAYIANVLVMVALALLFRYAVFVGLLGGSEYHLGWIVGIGMVGSLIMRVALGMGIDHYGPRLIWFASVVLLALTCFGHLAITSCTGPAIYALRILFCCSVAGIFGASMTFVSGRASSARTAEVIGMLGTAGFVGMVLGTQIGDLLLGTEQIAAWQVRAMFITAGSLASLSVVFVYLATRDHRHCVPSEHPPVTRLLRRHHPGMVFLVGTAMGIGLGLPGTFLITYAATLDIHTLGLFFNVYAATAIVARILTRRLPDRIGTTPMILAGLGMLAGSQLLLLLVNTKWQFVIPGFAFGLSHAILFPSVIAAGTRRFPAQHRGLATTVILATWDVGQLIGAPAAGVILDRSAMAGLLPYPTLFISVAGLLFAVAVAYALSTRRDGQSPAKCVSSEVLRDTEPVSGDACSKSDRQGPTTTAETEGAPDHAVTIDDA